MSDRRPKPYDPRYDNPPTCSGCGANMPDNSDMLCAECSVEMSTPPITMSVKEAHALLDLLRDSTSRSLDSGLRRKYGREKKRLMDLLIENTL